MNKETQPTPDTSTGVIHYLTRKFDSKVSQWEAPRSRTTQSGGFEKNASYTAQTEFMYLINEVMMGPPCMVQRNVTTCEDFINSLK